MKNSINNGSVNAGRDGYGITDIMTEARNVVSMGDVTGPSGSYTFWNASTDVDLFYGLDCKCKNCDGATLFKHNISTGFYEVVGTGEHVDDHLNGESVNQHFGMVWSKQLELVDKVTLVLNVSSLWIETFLVEPGTPLNGVGNLSDYFNDEELCVANGNRQPRIAIKPTHLVTRNMNVVVGKCMSVTVSAPVNKSETMIAGETLDHLAFFFHFSLDDFIVVAEESHQVLNQSSVTERNTVLKLCHNVNVSGLLNDSLIIEHGTLFYQIDKLSNYFGPFHVIYNQLNTSIVVNGDTQILHDVSVFVSNASKQVIVISFDEGMNVTSDDIKDFVTDMITLPDFEHLWIEVNPQDDGSFVISVIQTNTDGVDVGDVLTDCMNYNP